MVGAIVVVVVDGDIDTIIVQIFDTILAKIGVDSDGDISWNLLVTFGGKITNITFCFYGRSRVSDAFGGVAIRLDIGISGTFSRGDYSWTKSLL